MSRIIEVVVSPTGEVTVTAVGFVGPDCLTASRFVEQALGLVVADHKTADYYRTQAVEQYVQQ